MKILGETPNAKVLANYCKYLDARLDKLEGLISCGEPFQMAGDEVFKPRLGKHRLNDLTGKYYELDKNGLLIFDRKD